MATTTGGGPTPLSLDDLLLDPANPRIVEALPPSSDQPEILRFLLDGAGMKAREQWRQLELDEGWPGRPLGPVTQRVFERAGLESWVEDRKDAVDEEVRALEESSERPPAPALPDARR